jgi:hypothetical protein
VKTAMRVWDVNPGYLNRQSLLGEHREIHAIFAINAENKKGYARHPETLRWQAHLSALKRRHDLVVSEMLLRGYRHHSPINAPPARSWPDEFIDVPGRQFDILKKKYENREPGRIPLAQRTQQLWSQHKYSVLARDPEYYGQIGQRLAKAGHDISFEELALELTKMLRTHPSEGRLMNALYHMWGYVSPLARPMGSEVLEDPVALMAAIRELAMKHQVKYLLGSTALNDLHIWVSASPQRGDRSKP